MNTKKDFADALKRLEGEIGYSFSNDLLLQKARTQSGNKRSAFFGDAVLDFVVSEHLFRNFADLEQGQLTTLKSHLVCDEKLEQIVKKNGWDDYLVVEEGISRISKKMNSTFLEAVVGAIYLDGGLAPAEAFIYKFIVNRRGAEKEIKNVVSPKVRLYEFCQQQYGGFRPEPYLVSEDGPPHDRTFEMGYILKKEITDLRTDISATGTGKTKSDAETKAAEKVNRKLIRMGLMEKEF
ncbi:MAG: putative dsRNA-binding protein [Methanimicrococcus sp.]|nr:putative dsRNA-binding protein [Methanimicrococcus sp.]